MIKIAICLNLLDICYLLSRRENDLLNETLNEKVNEITAELDCGCEIELLDKGSKIIPNQEPSI